MPHEIIFAQQTLEAFSEDLGSSLSTPGGGAAAALSAAQGASLVAMVCSLTVGKEKYAQHQELAEEFLQKSRGLEKECLDLMDKDAIAFHEMMAVYKMPKSTPEEKEAHSKAKISALKACILPPMDVMEISVEGLSLIRGVLGKSNVNAVSDLGAAAVFFKSALEASWLNVVINLKDLPEDKFTKTQRNLGEELLENGKRQADELYQVVLEWLE